MINDPRMYFICLLITNDLLALNTLSPPAAAAASPCINAASAWVSMSRYGEIKLEMGTVDWRVNCILCHDAGLRDLSIPQWICLLRPSLIDCQTRHAE